MVVQGTEWEAGEDPVEDKSVARRDREGTVHQAQSHRTWEW